MIKKTMLIVLCVFFLFSCGKKSDPEYKDPGQKARIQSTLINKV